MARERLRLAATMAGVTALTLCIGLTGAWAASRNVRPVTHLATGALAASPSPSPRPTPTEPPPPTSLQGNLQLVAPSTHVAWALSDYDALFRSIDQGSIWEKRTLPAPLGGRPFISFVNASEGWLLQSGSPATQCEEATADVWHTTDGAATWRHVNISGIDKSQCKDGVWFIDAKHGFVSAADPNHQPTIYRTADGGSTWIGSKVPDPPDFKSSGAGFVLYGNMWIKAFGPTLYLEAVGSQDTGPHDRYYVFRSTDGGATWGWFTKVPPLPSLVMVTETRWLILAGGGMPQETVNGGQQWHPYTTDLNVDSPVLGGSAVVFANAQVGYETGRGLLQRSNDAGAHWVRIQSPGTEPETIPSPPSGTLMPNTAVLSAASTNAVWALVANQELFRSTDRGETWTQLLLPSAVGTEAPIPAFVDELTGFILIRSQTGPNCGDQSAQLWETMDGARTWHVVSTAAPDHALPSGLPFAECKDALYFADSRHGWLATGGLVSAARIWRTSDGGLTWYLGALNDPRLNALGGPPVRASVLKSYGSTVLAYLAPYVFRSTDGGAAWTYAAEVPPTSASVGFVTGTRWLQLISPDQASETTDAGSNWHTLTVDYSQADPIAPQIVFVDANVGYATVRTEVQRTLDGGAHWEMIKASWP